MQFRDRIVLLDEPAAERSGRLFEPVALRLQCAVAGVRRIHLRVPFEEQVLVEAAAPFPGTQRLQIEARLPLHGAKLPPDGIAVPIRRARAAP